MSGEVTILEGGARASASGPALPGIHERLVYSLVSNSVTMISVGLTIEQYRERFGLARDYPSTAASYSALRSEMAQKVGLGQQRRKAAPKAAEPVQSVPEKPRRAGRPRKANEASET